MSFIAFLFVGLIAGWIAGKIVEGRGFGMLGDMIIGIIGSFIGGILSSRILGDTNGFWGHVLVATLGAIVLLFIMKLFTGRTA